MDLLSPTSLSFFFDGKSRNDILIGPRDYGDSRGEKFKCQKVIRNEIGKESWDVSVDFYRELLVEKNMETVIWASMLRPYRDVSRFKWRLIRSKGKKVKRSEKSDQRLVGSKRQADLDYSSVR